MKKIKKIHEILTGFIPTLFFTVYAYGWVLFCLLLVLCDLDAMGCASNLIVYRSAFSLFIRISFKTYRFSCVLYIVGMC